MENKPQQAHILYSGSQISITSPYNSEFVSRLKSELKSRRWDPGKKVWNVRIEERQKLIDVASKFYQVVEDNHPTSTPDIISRLATEPVEATDGIELNAIIKPGTELEVWTDGACVVNPGPGGYGTVTKYQKYRWEKSGGFSLTTNNRMEIMAAIVGLEALPERCKVIVYTDSQYLANSIMKGWAKRWKSKNWVKKGTKRVPNADLWEKLLTLFNKHDVEFRWVKGHASSPENERCDELAEATARLPELPHDKGYLKEFISHKKRIGETSNTQEKITGTVCPICGGLGYRMVPSGPRSHKHELKMLCSQCTGKGTI
jgi:ribonuclease HI